MKIVLILLVVATGLLVGQIAFADRLTDATTQSIVKWLTFGLIALGAGAMARDGAALWCGLLSATAVVINPLWPLAIPADLAHAVLVGCAAVCGATVVRKWE